jgi:hypothetical protein
MNVLEFYNDTMSCRSYVVLNDVRLVMFIDLEMNGEDEVVTYFTVQF